MQEEVWKPCPGHERTHEVSSLGRVRSVGRVVRTALGTRTTRGRLLAVDYTHRKGYGRIAIYVGGGRRRRKVHALVCRAFHGDAPGPVGTRRGEWSVDHIDGDKRNNAAENLRWLPAEENFRRYVERGTANRGAAHPRAKLHEEDVREIRLQASGEATQRELAERFGISTSHVSLIVRRLSWKHVP